MTYNVLKGGDDHIDEIKEIIQSANPDVLAIQEACAWESNGFVEEVQAECGFVNYLYGEANFGRSARGFRYDTVLFSKYQLRNLQTFTDPVKVWHVITAATISVEFGDVLLINLHLSPKQVDWRLAEVDLVQQMIDMWEGPVMLMGDFNDLLVTDHYPIETITKLAEHTDNKFGVPPTYQVMNKFLDLGFKNHMAFSPTVFEESEDSDHFNLRLDYILTKDFPEHLSMKAYTLDNETTRKTSDHLPVILEVDESE